MRRFLRTLLFFLLPLLVGFTLIESFISLRPNSFNLRARYIKNNSDIEVLILGSSHMQNAIDPAVLTHKSSNLAYGRQNLLLNTELFYKYFKQLKDLKLVILELDYHTLTSRNESDYFRLSWYNRYHAIRPYKLKLIDRVFLYPSSPSFFNKYILRTLDPRSVKEQYNEQGFVLNNDHGVFESMDYDTSMIIETAPERLKNKHALVSSPDNLPDNLALLDQLMDFCEVNKIKLVFVTTPAYKTYRDHFDPKLVAYRHDFIQKVKNSGRHYVYFDDFESDNRFSVRDFINDDHLNSRGSEKFSKMIDHMISNLLP